MKKMGKIIFAFILFSGMSAFTSPKHKPELKCQAQKTAFAVDGKTNDWHNVSLSSDEKTGLAYALSNDSSNLYVRLKFTDGMVQRKALFTGLTLWIDPAGKGRHVLGIQFPRGRKQEQAHRSERGASGQHVPDEKRSRQAKERMVMLNAHLSNETPVLKGFDKAGLKAFSGMGGIEVAARIDSSKQLVYEAKIPLKMIFSQPKTYLSGTSAFSVTIETGYVQIDMSRMQGHAGPGGGGHMGGGQHPNPSRMAFMQSMAEPSRLKIKTIRLVSIK